MNRVFCILLLVPLFLSACATLYQPSETMYGGLTLKHNLSEAEMRDITTAVFEEAGYDVKEVKGKLVTEPRRMSLTQHEADCGRTLGVHHVDSDTTIIRVTMAASFEEDTVIFQSDIRGEHLKGDPLQGQEFKCESTGAMEREMTAAVRVKVEGE